MHMDIYVHSTAQAGVNMKWLGIIFEYTGCIKKMVIKLCSALARSLYNLQKSFFHSRKDQAFSFRMSPFLWNLKKDWANTSQMKIAGRNHIFPPLSIIMEANKKENSINHLSVI